MDKPTHRIFETQIPDYPALKQVQSPSPRPPAVGASPHPGETQRPDMEERRGIILKLIDFLETL